MSEPPTDWIAAAGLRIVQDIDGALDAQRDVLADPHLTLRARGLYAVLVAQQGRPIDPFDNAFEGEDELQSAIDELLSAGLAVRVGAP